MRQWRQASDGPAPLVTAGSQQESGHITVLLDRYSLSYFLRAPLVFVVKRSATNSKREHRLQYYTVGGADQWAASAVSGYRCTCAVHIHV